MEAKNSQQMISEVIRTIALDRNIDRLNMTQCGTGGIGMARMIHGYVAKINDRDDEYLGTIDVGEFSDETASSAPVIRGAFRPERQFWRLSDYFYLVFYTDSTIEYVYVLNFFHLGQLRTFTALFSFDVQ